MKSTTAPIEGIVLRIVGSSTMVDCGPHGVITCDLRGRLIRKLNQRLAVGDQVTLSLPGDGRPNTSGERGVIESIAPRRTALRRARESKREQIICANVDQVVVVVAAFDPPYKRSFIDRVLVAAERDGLPAQLLVNKLDLVVEDEHRALLEQDLEVYRELGYGCHFISARGGEGLEELRALLAGRLTVITGPSGVGKSTLLNELLPGIELRTGDIGRHGKGRHVTTTAILLPLPEGGFVVDTPGLRAFAVDGVTPLELVRLFPDLARYAAMCRFGDCQHRQEPGCGVTTAVDDDDIDLGRYESYVKILEDLVGAPRWRGRET